MSKRVFLLLLIGLILSDGLYAQRTRTARRGVVTKYTEFKAGFLNPKNTDAGNLLGISFGRRIDDRLFWGFGVEYFRTTFRQTTTVADSVGVGGIDFTTEQVELEFTTTILPVLLKLDYEIPTSPGNPTFFRASLGFGWEFVWNKEKNFQTGIDRTRRFDGFGWQASAGVGLRISQAGFIFVDGFYNGADTRRNEDRSVEGLPTFEVLSVSGFGFKFGLRLAGLGY